MLKGQIDTFQFSDFAMSISEACLNLDQTKIEELALDLWDAKEKGQNIFIFGNGGSHAIASHLACDLGKGVKESGSKKNPFRIFALDCAPWLTAQANDGIAPFESSAYPGKYSHGYDAVFVGQMENFIQAGDFALGISSSGNSQNIINALLFAKSRGAKTAALVGFDGGEAAKIADLTVLVKTEKGQYGIVESAHAMIHHYLYDLFKKMEKLAF
jgi:D-sedoheptulose 7-phosphate isomerase